MFFLGVLVASLFQTHFGSANASDANSNIHTRLKLTIVGCTNRITDEQAVFDLEILNDSRETIRINKNDLDTAFQIHTFRDNDKLKWRAKELGVLGDLPSTEADFSEPVDAGKTLRLKLVTRVLESKEKQAAARPHELKYSISDHITVVAAKATGSYKAILIGEGKFKLIWVE